MTNRPTILFGVTSSQSLRLLGNLPQSLMELDWDVHVVSNNNSLEAPDALRGAVLHHLPMLRNPAPIRDFFTFIRWITLLRQVKPSIVSIGTPKASLLGLIASKLCRVPVRIYHLRGLRLQTVKGLWRWVLYVLEFLTAKSSTRIVAVSKSLKTEYCRLLLSREDRVTVLGHGSSHGVDLDIFCRVQWAGWEPPQLDLREALRKKVPILGFVGRFSEDKGAMEILWVKQALREARIDYRLLIIGPVEGLEELLAPRGARDPHVIVTGPVREVAPYYSIIDLLLLPTRREGFPNVVLEAAAFGVPTVTTTATGAIDSVINGKTGLTVPVGDYVALADAVQNLLADSQRRLTLGRNALSRVRKHYSELEVTNLHRDFLVKQLGQNSKVG